MKAFLTVVFLFASQNAISQNANCLDGYWDLGPRAAVLAFECKQSTAAGEISFCNRKILIEKGYCTILERISCEWKQTQWVCEESGQYPFKAEIKRAAPNKIFYKFKSTFSEGELVGTLLN